ncbi:uncharacterized protein [Nicotiana tomentosiformis]|uniref:uncharacterized protein n=1 Tax=Nicotiana tomentosiformis TaxID=4098 RepID=UPI00388C75BA
MADALSRKAVSMGSLAYIPVGERALAADVHTLANQFVRLDVSESNRILTCTVARSSLYERIRERQYNDPHLLFLKDTVRHGGAKQVTVGEDGFLRMQGRISVPNVDGLIKVQDIKRSDQVNFEKKMEKIINDAGKKMKIHVDNSAKVVSAQARGGTFTPAAHTPERVMQGLQTPGVLPAQPVAAARAPVVPVMADDEQRRLERFGRLQPLSFSGAESEDAQGFLDNCQRILRTTGVLETSGVSFTTFQFIGDVFIWWEGNERRRPVSAVPLTWQEFSVLFLENFVLQSRREEQRILFEQLRQDGISMTQYVKRFFELDCHAVWLVPTGRERIMRYSDYRIGIGCVLMQGGRVIAYASLNVQALANQFVRLDVSQPIQVLACVVSLASLSGRIIECQYDDPHLLFLKDTVQHGDARDVTIGDDGERLRKAQSRQKRYADKKVRDVAYMVREKYFGDPSPVLDFIMVQLDGDLTYDVEPVTILGRHVRKLRSKDISSVKVQWRGQPVEEAA